MKVSAWYNDFQKQSNKKTKQEKTPECSMSELWTLAMFILNKKLWVVDHADHINIGHILVGNQVKYKYFNITDIVTYILIFLKLGVYHWWNKVNDTTVK